MFYSAYSKLHDSSRAGASKMSKTTCTATSSMLPKIRYSVKSISMEDNIPHTKEGALFVDDRGHFAPFLDNAEIPVRRVYYVVNHSPGVIRGFHFHEKEWKYFTIVQGMAKFVALTPEKPEETFTFVS